ncbi:MAG TPA: GNAT family N-acetyltransferase [Sphingomonas sp.]
MIDYRDATIADRAALAAMAIASFRETFAHLYRAADLDAFLADAFGPDGLPADIGDPAYAIRLALDDGRIVGFAKIGPCKLPDPAPRAAAELHQLYVLRGWQGSGVAAALMAWSIATARARGATILALGVYSDNARAQRFYARHGLVEIGRYLFPVGKTMDDERIWSMSL